MFSAYRRFKINHLAYLVGQWDNRWETETLLATCENARDGQDAHVLCRQHIQSTWEEIVAMSRSGGRYHYCGIHGSYGIRNASAWANAPVITVCNYFGSVDVGPSGIRASEVEIAAIWIPENRYEPQTIVGLAMRYPNVRIYVGYDESTFEPFDYSEETLNRIESTWEITPIRPTLTAEETECECDECKG